MSVEPVEIPDKRYFKIGEVSKLTGLKTHTLRYWESEFKVIRPQRAGSNQRMYRREDVLQFIRIRKLIQEDGLTLSGVKKFLAREPGANTVSGCGGGQPMIEKIKTELQQLKAMLE